MKTLVRIAAVIVVGGAALFIIYVGISRREWLYIVAGLFMLLQVVVAAMIWLRSKD